MIEIDFSKCVDPVFFFSNTYAAAYILHKAIKHYGKDIEVYYPISDVGEVEQRMNRIANMMETLGVTIRPTVLPLHIINYPDNSNSWTWILRTVKESVEQLVNYEVSRDPLIFNQAELDLIAEIIPTRHPRVLTFLSSIYRAGWLDETGNVLPLDQFPRRTAVFSTYQSKEAIVTDVLFNRLHEKNNSRLMNGDLSAYSPFYAPLLMYNDKELFESAMSDHDLLDALLSVHKCLTVQNAFCGECEECIFRKKMLFDLEIIDPTKYVFV